MKLNDLPTATMLRTGIDVPHVVLKLVVEADVAFAQKLRTARRSRVLVGHIDRRRAALRLRTCVDHAGISQPRRPQFGTIAAHIRGMCGRLRLQ